MNINEILKNDLDICCKELKKATKKIEKLEEENKVLKELNVCVGCEDNPTYKTRIDKAIEYIESKIQHRSYKVNDIIRKYDYLEMFDETIVELLDILKGKDE